MTVESAVIDLNNQPGCWVYVRLTSHKGSYQINFTIGDKDDNLWNSNLDNDDLHKLARSSKLELTSFLDRFRQAFQLTESNGNFSVLFVNKKLTWKEKHSIGMKTLGDVSLEQCRNPASLIKQIAQATLTTKTNTDESEWTAEKEKLLRQRDEALEARREVDTEMLSALAARLKELQTRIKELESLKDGESLVSIWNDPPQLLVEDVKPTRGRSRGNSRGRVSGRGRGRGRGQLERQNTRSSALASPVETVSSALVDQASSPDPIVMKRRRHGAVVHSDSEDTIDLSDKNSDERTTVNLSSSDEGHDFSST